MHHLTRSLLVCALSLGSLTYSLPAQDAVTGGDPFVKGPTPAAAKNTAPWQNSLTVFEVYALDKSDALALLDAESNGPARYRRVLELAKTGKARLDTLTALATKSGQRGKIEGIDEVRYPTEFSPPEIKDGICAPTAWETRNVGDSLETEIVVGPDRRTCDYNLVPRRTTLLGFRDIGAIANDNPISQPMFVSQKITTSIFAREGETAYLGTMSPPTGHGIVNGGEKSEVWLAFLRPYLPGPTAEELKAKPTPPMSVNLKYTCYSLERTQALEVLSSGATLTGPWEKLQSLVSEKKARLEHFSTLNTKSGQRAVTEEVEEYRFATESAPESKEPTQTEVVTRSVSSPNPEKEGGPITSRETTSTVRTDANSARRPGYNTAFETRNLGVTVEVEPVVGKDGVTVDLNQSVQSVTLRGDLQVSGIATRYPALPLIETRQVVNSVSALIGRPTLIGTLNPPGVDGVNGRKDSGRTWLLFVTAENGL